MNKKINLLMKNIKIYKMKSTFIKLFISYIIIILFIAIINIFTYNYLKTTLVTKEIDINKNYLNYYGKVIDEKFINISKEIFSFLHSSENKSRFKKIDNIYDKNYLISELNKLAYNNSLIDMCMIYSKNMDSILYNEGSINKQYMFKEYYRFEDMEQKVIHEIIESNSRFKYLPTQKVFINNKTISFRNFLMFYTSLNYSNNIEKFIALVDEEEIISSVKDGVISDYGICYIVDKDGNIISSTDKDAVTHKIEGKYIEEINKNNGFNFNYDNKLIVYSKSEFTDWYYITVTPYNSILKNIEHIKKFMLYSLLFLVILGLIIAFIASRLYYKPIVQILESFDNLQNNKEYKNEFAQIMSNVNHLQIESERNKENRIMLQAIKNGKIEGKLKEKFKFDQFIVMQIICNNSDALYDYIMHIKKSFINNCVMKVINENEHTCIAILNQNNINNEHITEYLYDIKCEYNLNVMIGLGNIVTTIYDISDSYEQAVNIIKYGNSSNETCIYSYNVDIATNNSIYIPLDFKQKLVENIYLGNRDAIENIIIDIFNKNAGIPNSYMHNLLVEIINAYMRISSKFNYKCDIDKITSNIDKIHSVEERKKYFCDCFKSLIKDNQIQEDKSIYVGEYVINYIEKNYKKSDLSIELISESINLSTAYISTLFKKYQGIAFSQYLVEYRVEKSKDLLTNTNKKIKDISEQVGFGTYNNFARTFKKKVGISPNEYRLSKIENKPLSKI